MEKYTVKLTKEERENLSSLTKTGKNAASKILHARILLASDEGDYINPELIKTDKEVAQLLDVNESTVKRVRKRVVEEGLEAALLRRQHSRTRGSKILGEEEAHLIAICCSPPPLGRSKWTLKLLSDQLVRLEVVESVSPATVGRVLKKKRIKTMAKKGMVYSS
jgi:transposase